MRAPSSPCCGWTQRMPASARSSASSTPAARRSAAASRPARSARCSAGAPDVVERGGDAGGDFAARLVGDQRDPLARLDRQADFDGVVRARARDPARQGPKTIAVGIDRGQVVRSGDSSIRTTKAGTWPPPEVTLARPVALRRVRKPGDAPAEEIRREIDEHVALDDRRRAVADRERLAADGDALLRDPAALALARARARSRRPTPLRRFPSRA